MRKKIRNVRWTFSAERALLDTGHFCAISLLQDATDENGKFHVLVHLTNHDGQRAYSHSVYGLLDMREILDVVEKPVQFSGMLRVPSDDHE